MISPTFSFSYPTGWFTLAESPGNVWLSNNDIAAVLEAGEPGAEDVQAQLPRLLAKELPNFMQPQVIHWRDTMPLNPNGKIDRTALKRELSV